MKRHHNKPSRYNPYAFLANTHIKQASRLGDHVIHAALNADRIDLHQVMGVTALDHSDASKASYRIRPLTRREIDRVGGSHPIAVDVRVLAATNRDLQAAMAAGTFRQDLFYRLNVFPIQLPSLRERVDDIPLLVEYLIERYAKKAGKKLRRISKKTLAELQAYAWPGNIRELQNVIERAVILCDGETFSVEETWLKHELPRASTQLNMPLRRLGRLDAQQEREMIEAALADSHGRIAGPSGAAAKLRLPRQTLESKIASLGINKHRFKSGDHRRQAQGS